MHVSMQIWVIFCYQPYLASWEIGINKITGDFDLNYVFPPQKDKPKQSGYNVYRYLVTFWFLSFNAIYT